MTTMVEYCQLIETIGQEARSSGEPLSLFTTHRGSEFNRELLVCGRATNGSEPAWTLQDAATPDAARRIVEQTLAKRAESACSMRWITESWRPDAEYNTARSAFWRVSRAISTTLSLVVDPIHWSSSLAWTNLYRVAPASRGNPLGQLRRIQSAWCSKALRDDIADLRPKRLLIMTGSDWAAPFVDMDSVEWKEPSELVQGWGKWRLASGDQIAVVIAKHPERKPQERFVGEVIKAFERVA